MLSRLVIVALWSPAGKGLISLHSFVMVNCVFVTFPCGIMGQVWYLIVLISDLCHLSYFVHYMGMDRLKPVFWGFGVCDQVKSKPGFLAT